MRTVHLDLNESESKDMMGLSRIMANYGYYNTSESSKISSKYAFEALAFMAEVFTFAYLGMQVTNCLTLPNGSRKKIQNGYIIDALCMESSVREFNR
jgi:NhaP-type Na+/H+ or K+/H+ antiporter